MWYMPYLRVRRAVVMYASLAAGISFVIVALGIGLRYWHGADHLDTGGPSGPLSLSLLLQGSAAFVGGLATVLGLNLAAENDGHLEVAWTKPVSREGYALGVFAVDIGAMAVCLAVTALCGAIIADVYAGAQIVTLAPDGRSLQNLEYCGLPLLVYAWIAALSASLTRNRGAIAGLFWPVMLVLAVLPHVPLPPFAAVAPVLATLNLLNPVELYTAASQGAPPPIVGTYAFGWLVAALLLTATLVQWRRLQL